MILKTALLQGPFRPNPLVCDKLVTQYHQLCRRYWGDTSFITEEACYNYDLSIPKSR